MNDCSPSLNRGPSQAFTRWLGARRDLPELGPVRGRTGSGAGNGHPEGPGGGVEKACHLRFFRYWQQYPRWQHIPEVDYATPIHCGDLSFFSTGDGRCFDVARFRALHENPFDVG